MGNNLKELLAMRQKELEMEKFKALNLQKFLINKTKKK